MNYTPLIKTIKNTLILLLSRREVTERYPDPIAKRILPKRSRGFLGIDVFQCTLCELCKDICPTGAIYINPNRKAFMIDYAKCLFCGLCVEHCPEYALIFSKDFEGATSKKTAFLYEFIIRKNVVRKKGPVK
jgi:formate hydrogenlyase subunit 6/NADH:ubiquinone oxidoreductase subunit I